MAYQNAKYKSMFDYVIGLEEEASDGYLKLEIKN